MYVRRYVPINCLDTKPVDSTVDVLGVVRELGNVVAFTSKAGKEMVKRELVLVDKTATSVNVTCWGPHAAALSDHSSNVVVSLKNVKVRG